MSDDAYNLIIHYMDGVTRTTNRLDWCCDRSGVIVKIEGFGVDDELLWTWIPKGTGLALIFGEWLHMHPVTVGDE